MRVTAYGSKINMHGCKSHYNYNSFRPWPCSRISASSIAMVGPHFSIELGGAAATQPAARWIGLSRGTPTSVSGIHAAPLSGARGLTRADHGWRGPGVNGPRALIPAARYAPGMGRTGMISTDSPGKIAKCGWFSNSFAAASCESARTTV